MRTVIRRMVINNITFQKSTQYKRSVDLTGKLGKCVQYKMNDFCTSPSSMYQIFPILVLLLY